VADNLNMLDFVEAMVVRTDKEIKSFKDLEGKTIAAPFGSTTHYLLLQALADEGLDPASMKILDLRPNDIAVAWSRGDIDAAWFWEPNLDKTVKDGGNIFMTSGIMEKRGYPTWDVGVVMNEFADAYPDLVEKFVAAECEGIEYWISNPAATAKIIAEELELSLEDATRMMRGTEMVPCEKQLTSQYIGTSEARGGFVDTLIATSDFLVSQDRLPGSPTRETFETFLHPQYLEAVVSK
jgi:taurine transport system substrate-binding protein